MVHGVRISYQGRFCTITSDVLAPWRDLRVERFHGNSSISASAVIYDAQPCPQAKRKAQVDNAIIQALISIPIPLNMVGQSVNSC